jgi:hypothetical protein
MNILERLTQAGPDGNNNRKVTLLAGLGLIITIAVIWILISLMPMLRGSPAARAKAPSGPQWTRAHELAERLHADERYKLLSVFPAPENPKELVVSGEVMKPADAAALDGFLKEMNLDFPYQVQVEALTK